MRQNLASDLRFLGLPRVTASRHRVVRETAQAVLVLGTALVALVVFLIF